VLILVMMLVLLSIQSLVGHTRLGRRGVAVNALPVVAS
jgi:hypothetical protein